MFPRTSLASPLSFSPVIAALFAWLFLGETLTSLRMAYVNTAQSGAPAATPPQQTPPAEAEAPAAEIGVPMIAVPNLAKHLGEIANRYRVSLYSLRRANGLRGDTIHVGSELLIPTT